MFRYTFPVPLSVTDIWVQLELSNSTERRQVSEATSSEIGNWNQRLLTKQDSYQFFPNVETAKSMLKFLNVNALHFEPAKQKRRHLTGKALLV